MHVWSDVVVAIDRDRGVVGGGDVDGDVAGVGQGAVGDGVVEAGGAGVVGGGGEGDLAAGQVTVPPVGLDTAVTVGVVPSGSVSLASTSVAGNQRGAFGGSLVSSTATGASLSSW